MNHNSLIYQDSNAYQIGRKDERMEWAEKVFGIIDKSYNTGYKDAMDFVCEWLYIYYPTIERCQSAEEAWKILEKEMKENLNSYETKRLDKDRGQETSLRKESSRLPNNRRRKGC